MARIPRDVVEAVRDRTDIVQVVSQHVKLQRRGGSLVGLCPFHQEKSPSFNVVPAKAMYYCFGCQNGGDVFKFLMQINGLSFAEAVKELAGPAGVEIPERELSPEERRQLRARASLYDLMQAAQEFFHSKLLTSAEGQVARDYLQRRAMTQQTIEEHGLGWAPAGWTSLVDHLQNQGYPAGLILQGGLAKQSDRGNGRIYDAFRERVIIPIRDERGRVIAFGGRLLEGDGPKYINSPETPLYNKSKVLYGLEAARKAISRRDRVLLVEGYFDVLSLHQAGFTEAVATCGTSLTDTHVQKLRRLSQNIVVLMDADTAGTRAAARTLPMFVTQGMQAWRLQLPDAKDPDELIREGGPEAMEDALKLKEPLLEWYTTQKLQTYGYSDSGRSRTLDEMVDLLGHLSPAQVSTFAALLRMNEQLILQRVAERRADASSHGEAPPYHDEGPPQAQRWRPERDIVHLLWLVVHRRDQVADLMSLLDPQVLEGHGPILEPMARLLQGESLATVIHETSDVGVNRTLQAIGARTRLYSEDEAAHALGDVLHRICKPLYEGTLQRLQRQSQQLRDRGLQQEMMHTLQAVASLQTRKRTLQDAIRHGRMEDAIPLLAPIVDLPETTDSP